MKRLFISFILVLIPLIANAQVGDDYKTAFVLYNRSTWQMENIDPTLSTRKLPPCSTFKIYNTLIGLELGLLKNPDEPWYTWDGVVRDIEGWNKNLTLREAFRVSAVPAFQILARQIGQERMKKYIDTINYGTKDITAGIDIFWLNRNEHPPILISAQEQLELLNKLLDGKLPFKQENITTLKSIMQVVKTDKGILYGKTGTGSSANGHPAVGWFVGFVEHNNTIYTFACNITDGPNPSGKVARGIVEGVLKGKGLL